MVLRRLAVAVALVVVRGEVSKPFLVEQQQQRRYAVAKQIVKNRFELAVPDETVTVFALDAGAKLESHAFSAIAALSSVVHFSAEPLKLRFVMMLTAPREAADVLSEALCRAIESAIGHVYARYASKIFEEKCFMTTFAEIARPANGTSCPARPRPPAARVTFVQFPVTAAEYPPEVRELFELFCCSSRRYAINRPELARSLGNHARFFAHLTLLPLGVKRALFLDADVLARVDVRPLYAAPLTTVRFVAAAKRCAQKRARYQPHFAFSDELLKEFGLKSNAMLVNAGVLVVDLQAYCRDGLFHDLRAVLRRHVAGPPLWRDGNNQPPFTIAAARHITFVDPSWNVRLGDAQGQARVARVQRRKQQRNGPRQVAANGGALTAAATEDVCTRMLEDPWILHAHFNPCAALPDRLCPDNNAHSINNTANEPLRDNEDTQHHTIPSLLRYVSLIFSCLTHSFLGPLS